MKGDLASIHPELRRRAGLIRFFFPSFSKRTFRLANWLLTFRKGKCRRKLTYQEHYLPRKDGSQLRLCLYTPFDANSQPGPALLWLHGGGYALGIPEQDEAMMARLIAAGCKLVVSPDYRLSLEAPYPAALEDAYAALSWLQNQCPHQGVKDRQIMVGGSSAGAGLAAALSLYARDQGQPALAFQILIYPMLDDRMMRPSAVNNKAPLWNSRSNALAWKLYLGDRFQSPDLSPYASPGRNEDFSDLPPAFAYVGSLDPFRDETIAYMEGLESQGIPVHFRLFQGCFHAFDLVCPHSSPALEATSFLIDSFNYAKAHYMTAEQKEEQTKP